MDPHEQPIRKKSKKTGKSSSGLIPLKNPTALVAYYLGVFSLLPVACFIVGMLRLEQYYGKTLMVIWGLGIILAPAAVLLGLFGLRTANLYPKIKGKGHAITGIVLGGLALIAHVVCVVVLLATNLSEHE